MNALVDIFEDRPDANFSVFCFIIYAATATAGSYALKIVGWSFSVCFSGNLLGVCLREALFGIGSF